MLADLVGAKEPELAAQPTTELGAIVDGEADLLQGELLGHIDAELVEDAAYRGLDARMHPIAVARDRDDHQVGLAQAHGRDNIGAAAVRSRRDGFETPLEPLKYSQTALSLLKGLASEEALQRVNHAKAPFTENVKNLLVLLRVFTFG